MSKARIHALRWFYSKGAVINALAESGSPSAVMMNQMQNDGQIEMYIDGWVLTDKGRIDMLSVE